MTFFRRSNSECGGLRECCYGPAPIFAISVFQNRGKIRAGEGKNRGRHELQPQVSLPIYTDVGSAVIVVIELLEQSWDSNNGIIYVQKQLPVPLKSIR
jgi:hypothetical protein